MICFARERIYQSNDFTTTDCQNIQCGQKITKALTSQIPPKVKDFAWLFTKLQALPSLYPVTNPILLRVKARIKEDKSVRPWLVRHAFT